MISIYTASFRKLVVSCLIAIVLIVAAKPAIAQPVCVPPQITSDPFVTQTPCQRELAFTWVLTAVGDELTYQWYSNTINSNTGGTAMTDETTGFFTPSTQIAGTFYYYCIVTGACGTAVSGTAQLTVRQAPVISGSYTDVLCYGAPTGSIDLTVTGGTSPYTYSWLGTGTIQGLEDQTGLFAGGNNVIVTGADGCSSEETFIITEPEPMALAEDHVDVLCFNGTSTFNISATGGITPYIGTGQFTQGAGEQPYIVTDANGCTASITVVVTQPEQLIASSAASPIATIGGTTTVTVSATGGTPPYTGTGSFVRGAGTHAFIVTDANGCSDTTTITLIDPVCIVVNAGPDRNLCNGPVWLTANVMTSGNPPCALTYRWYYGGSILIATTQSIPVFIPGTYIVKVTNCNGCIDRDTVVVTLCPPVDPNKCYKLIARHSGKALTIKNASTANGADAEQRSYSGGLNQVWKFESVENDYYKIVNVNSGKVLEVTGGSTANGADVQQWTWDGGNDQKWNLDKISGNYYGIKAKHSQKYMAIANASTSNGASVEQRGSSASENSRQWEIKEVGCPNANTKTTELIVTTAATEERDQTVLAVAVQPNPSVNYFSITVQSNDKVTPVIIQLFDVNGKVMLTSSKLNVNSTWRIDAGKWTGGIYLAEVVQGSQRKMVRLVKTN